MQEHFVAEDEVKQYLTKLPTLSPEEQIGNVTKRKATCDILKEPPKDRGQHQLKRPQ
ncbi:MAG: hypothetical protein HWD59_05380 [Coxiellaceae bacterium]|nr:MAG: hypothetical protein HWD59_05380 [Coxiellaceae bacterium]